MKRLLSVSALSIAMLCLAAPSAQAKSFAKLVGEVKAAPVKKQEVLEAPFLTWGGDVGTFHANGGAETQAGSIYDKLGLKVKSVNGDDFVAQVRRYMKGETPLLRGTVRMIGMASEVINSDPSTQPVMFLQLTWSAGDHMVARKSVASLNDLKGKKIALQEGGPHVGMLDDVLHAARLKWSDITAVFVKDLTGPGGAAAKFKSDPSIDACFVISPDMASLVGGLHSKGSGAGGTVKDARVLVSTAQMSRSIADVYVCRKDFYDANKATIEKFAAGYLKSCEEIVTLKGKFEKGGNKEYRGILQLAQDMFGKEVLPTLEADAHGLISDCTYVGLPGNVSFFTDKGNLSGFAKKSEAAIKLATEQGYAAKKTSILNNDLNFEKLSSLGGATFVKESKPKERFAEMSADDLFPDDPIKKESATIFSFTINFEPNQSEFSAAKYGEDFQRAVEAASTFGNAAIAIGGHADPTLMLRQLVESGMKAGALTREGERGSYTYKLNGQAFDLTDTAAVLAEIKKGTFGNVPEGTRKALNKLSQARADSVRKAIIDFASSKGYRLDPSQIKPVGVGPREPKFAKPTKREEALGNMRVEFKLVKVAAEILKGDGMFDDF